MMKALPYAALLTLLVFLALMYATPALAQNLPAPLNQKDEKLYKETNTEQAARALGAVIFPPTQAVPPNSPELAGELNILLDLPQVSKTGKFDLKIKVADMPAGATKLALIAEREKTPVLAVFELNGQKKLDVTYPVQLTRTGSLWVVISMTQGPAWYIKREVKVAQEKW